MAETSGFFDAEWDPDLPNEETGELGDWDVRYLVKQFTDYFKLFIGNGVFVSPTNQLKVIPGNGLSVLVSEGWAFINGMWYHNDDVKVLTLTQNTSGNGRVDTIRVRYSEASKSITAVVVMDDSELVRTESMYDLKIADVTVVPFAVEVTAANITDTRPDESVCGFVKGLLEVVSTEDLFAQFQGIFDEWFAGVKDQLTGDLAIRLQQEFEELNQNVVDYKNETQNLVNEAKKLVADFVEKDFVIPLQPLVFVDKVCTITDERITDATLIDVYFTEEAVQEAIRCVVFVHSHGGYIQLVALRQPSKALDATIRVRVN